MRSLYGGFNIEDDYFRNGCIYEWMLLSIEFQELEIDGPDVPIGMMSGGCRGRDSYEWRVPG